ncbi:MAG: phage holin [Lachnospiraceae bacterium]|nr:phage holin [Lachnospiraceae bacterium]
MNEITFDILKIVVSICAALVTAYVIPYIKTLKEDKRYASLVAMVEVAVKAAEQTFKEAGQGAAKKEEVMNFTAEWMKKQGIDISRNQLDQLIEAAVWQMKQEG